MALANMACYLARTGKVLAVDWDLDSPGLGQYFGSLLPTKEGVSRTGVLDFFEEWVKRSQGESMPQERFADVLDSLDIDSYMTRAELPNLSYMAVGRVDASYVRRLASFDWQALHATFPGLLTAFAVHLSQRFDYVLVDSRSGHSDVAGICATLLPEKLVAVFVPNRQSLQGLATVIRRALEYRKQSDDIRPLTVFPLASRVELSEPGLLDEWRLSRTEPIGSPQGYQSLFEELFKDLYGLPTCDLSRYFDEILIQHVPKYAFGEEIAIVKERGGDRLSLSRSFSDFGEVLKTMSTPWESRPLTNARRWLRDQDEPVDESWFEQQRQKARMGLSSLGFSGFAEYGVSLLGSRPNAKQSALLEAARSAQIEAFGWPIGAVLDREEATRPRPTNDGIVAELSFQQAALGPSYDYWTWRRNGDFYILESLFEDRRSHKGTRIFFDTRIWRLAEALLYCGRVYRRLGVSDDTSVRFSARWGGLKGRYLAAADPFRLFPSGNASAENEVLHSVTFAMPRTRADFTGLVMELLGPLFMVFDFQEFKQSVYESVLGGFLSRVSQPRLGAQVFRTELGGYLLDVEQEGSRWISRVYDRNGFQKVHEVECADEPTAKANAVMFAQSELGTETPGEATGISQISWRLYPSL